MKSKQCSQVSESESEQNNFHREFCLYRSQHIEQKLRGQSIILIQ